MPVKFTKALLGTLLLGASLNAAAADQTLLNSSYNSLMQVLQRRLARFCKAYPRMW